MRRSRSSDIPIGDTPVIIDPPSVRDRVIFEILYWHTRLPSHWIRYHFPGAANSQAFITRLGHLREKQNAYIKWSDWPLNVKAANNKHSVYELAFRGAKIIERGLPRAKRLEAAHELIVALHECSLKFEARAAGTPFQFLEACEYRLPSGLRWVPDGHPIIIGHPGDETLIHSEIERRKYNESPQDTEEKIEKTYEYMKARLYKADARKALVLFLSASPGRTSVLKRYVQEKYGDCTFFGFGTTRDWVQEASFPKPHEPLVSEWERVGHPPLRLFEKEVPIEHT